MRWSGWLGGRCKVFPLHAFFSFALSLFVVSFLGRFDFLPCLSYLLRFFTRLVVWLLTSLCDNAGLVFFCSSFMDVTFWRGERYPVHRLDDFVL